MTPGGKQYVLTIEQSAGATENVARDGELMKIRVGNLQPGATEPQIRAMFLPHGQVRFYQRPLNEFTRRPGLVAYVEMPIAQGTLAIRALKGTRLAGEVVTVEVADELASWAPNASRSPGSQTPRRTITPYVEGDRERARGGSNA